MSDQHEDEKKRGPGRPKAAEPGSAVMVWLPISTHDRIAALANRRDVSVSALIRQLLTLKLR